MRKTGTKQSAVKKPLQYASIPVLWQTRQTGLIFANENEYGNDLPVHTNKNARKVRI